MSKVPGPIKELAEELGATINECEKLPDGSGFATMSMPLPAGHWLTADGYNEPPMPFRIGTDQPQRKTWEAGIRAAARYAIRASTMNGKEGDFDPDAMVQNMVVGMIGYFTTDGTSKL